MSTNTHDIIISKMLVAVDGSEPSLRAADKAIYLAQKHAAELIVLYIIPPNVRYGYTGDGVFLAYTGPLKEVVDIAMENGQKYVDEVKQKASSKDINIQTEVILGTSSIVKEIVEYSEKHNVDQIVVGCRGMSGIKKMLLGSTASGVVTYAHCPVMVVK